MQLSNEIVGKNGAGSATDSAPATWQFYPDHVENWTYWENLFSPIECKEIIRIGTSKNLGGGFIGGNEGAIQNTEVRDSNVVFLGPTDETGWIFQRMSQAITSLNERFFKFDIFGMCENIQFTEYKAPAGKYDRHIDRGMGNSVRKLSVVIQLSDPADYEGGELELFYSGEPVIASKSQGHLTMFPSYVLHGVKPVTKGKRYSLVAWIAGKPFK